MSDNRSATLRPSFIASVPRRSRAVGAAIGVEVSPGAVIVGLCAVGIGRGVGLNVRAVIAGIAGSGMAVWVRSGPIGLELSHRAR